MSQDFNISSRRKFSIFISYRRDDTAGHAGHLYALLSDKFPGHVFMDLDKIEPGQNFAEVIRDTISVSDVLIVLIGREWLSIADEVGHRRLDSAKDLVRIEVATALSRDMRVIPVLVEGARMPRPEELPPELQELAGRNALEISDTRLGYDVERLVRALKREIPGSASGIAPVPVTNVSSRKRMIALMTASLVTLGIIGFFILSSVRRPKPVVITDSENGKPSPLNTTGSANQPQLQAFVNRSESKAEFIFPVSTDDRWKWNLTESRHGDEEYSWQVEVQNGRSFFNIYLANYNTKKFSQQEGTLKELIGHISTVRGVQEAANLDKSKWMIIDGSPKLDTSTPGRLRMMLEGAVVKRIFSENPTNATFKSKTPGGVRELELAPVVYRD